MATVRDALRIKDPRLSPVVAAIVLCVVVDFFVRVVLVTPGSSQPQIEEVVTFSDAIPQISQQQLDSVLSNMSGLMTASTRVEAAQPDDDLAVNQPSTEPTDGYWRSEVFSLKLLAVAKRAVHFAVIHKVHNVTGTGELLELREGEAFDDYLVDQISPRQLRLLAADGEIVNLTLFEPDLVEGALQ